MASPLRVCVLAKPLAPEGAAGGDGTVVFYDRGVRRHLEQDRDYHEQVRELRIQDGTRPSVMLAWKHVQTLDGSWEPGVGYLRI